MRWGMVIDLRKCVGCQTCTVACHEENALPPGVFWRHVVDVEVGEYPDVRRTFLPMGCQHCAEPPCVPVCPTGASQQREDGIVFVQYDMCIGCGYCAIACPYRARHMVHDHEWYFMQATP
ncbi:MAG: 4Fe-4S dicluster domain-containing protein, partial [Burkholderiales bacterium]